MSRMYVPKVSSKLTVVISVLILSVLTERCRAITSYRPRPIPIRQDWEADVFPGADWERGSRSTYPNNVPPQPPWEEALRQSVYLTLVRDKIDELIAGGGAGRRQVSEEDINLWREIRKAPLDRNSQERGPVFGDIAILSRGKLTETHRGFRFIEDENVKECIECHIYGARPNELEAEKKLVRPCGPDQSPGCSEGGTRALWTVRRIRHRNPEGDPTPFRYELMFSIASANPSGTKLEYDAPSQTFTVQETEKETGARHRKGKLIFEDEIKDTKKKNNYYPKHSSEEGQYVYEVPKRKSTQKRKDIYFPKSSTETEDEEEERKYWEHKQYEADRRRPDYVPKVSQEYYHGYRGGDRRPPLNTGEVYFEEDARKKYPVGYDESHVRPETEVRVKQRGHKKYGVVGSDEDFADVENYKYSKGNTKPPTITHLHHHYYLNDKGIPILKTSSKSHEYPNYESYIPTMFQGFNNGNEGKPASVEKFSSHFNEFPVRMSPTETHNDHTAPKSMMHPTPKDSVSTTPVYITPESYSTENKFPNHTMPTMSHDSTISNSNTQHETIFRTPFSPQTTPVNEHPRFLKPTKPFRPSPVDPRVRFSELDPLFPPTVSTTTLYKTTNQQASPTSLATDSQVSSTSPIKTEEEETSTYENSQTAPTQTAFETTEIEKQVIEEITEPPTEITSPDKTTENVSPISFTTEGGEESTQITITRPLQEITTMHVETTQIIHPEPVTNVRENIPKKKIERTNYKTNRRVKLQKKFSELVNAQMSPPPENVVGTTISYPVSSAGTTDSLDAVQSESKITELPHTTSTRPPSTRKKFTNFTSRRNTRLKYERTPSNLGGRRVRPKVSIIKAASTTPETVINVTESQIEVNSNVDNITDSIAVDNDNTTAIDDITTENITEQINDTATSQTQQVSKSPYYNTIENDTRIEEVIEQIVEEILNETTTVAPMVRNVNRNIIKFPSSTQQIETTYSEVENDNREILLTTEDIRRDMPLETTENNVRHKTPYTNGYGERDTTSSNTENSGRYKTFYTTENTRREINPRTIEYNTRESSSYTNENTGRETTTQTENGRGERISHAENGRRERISHTNENNKRGMIPRTENSRRRRPSYRSEYNRRNKVPHTTENKRGDNTLPTTEFNKTDKNSPTTENNRATASRTESSNNRFSERQDDIFTPLTRKSYVTSISLKLGNKTRPYYQRSTEPPNNDSIIVKKRVQIIENSTFMEDLLNEFDFDKATKAKISEVTSSGALFKVYTAEEENSEHGNLETNNEEMDNLTQQVIDHAKTINLLSLNITSDS